MRINELEQVTFQDLDGCLANFDKSVFEIFGKQPDDIPVKELWRELSKPEHDFYNRLDWMPDGKELWSFVRTLDPFLLTGLPMGRWAEPQKREWCTRELQMSGSKVITCMARDKPKEAAAALGRALNGDILIDDREKARAPWESAGGVFVLHTSASNTIKQVKDLKNV